MPWRVCLLGVALVGIVVPAGSGAARVVRSVGRARTPAPRIMFASVRTGTDQVYSIRTDGSGLAQLTFGVEGARSPRPSPNGRLVFYTGTIVDGFAQTAAVATASGRQISSGRSYGLFGSLLPMPSWSPDSRSLVAAAGAGLRLYRAARLGPARPLTSANENDLMPVFSPGGKAIAFLRYRGSGQALPWELVVLRNGNETTLASTDRVGPLAWSVDGRQIAFTTSTDTEVISARGGGAHRVFAAPADVLAWSPTGADLAMGGRAGVVVISANGTAETIAPVRLNSLVWWRRSLYGADGTRLLRLGLDGQVQTLFQTVAGDDLRDAALWRPPPGTSFHAPESVIGVGVAKATPTELDTGLPVTGLAADGDAVAVSLGCRPNGDGQDVEVVWHPGDSDYAGPHIPGACSVIPEPLQGRVYALAGENPVVLRGQGGISSFFWELDLGADRVATGTGGCCAGDPLRARVGWLLGQDTTAVYSTWDLCTSPCDGDLPPNVPSYNRISQQQIIRASNGTTREIYSAPGEHSPLALDAGRIAVRSHATTLDLIDLDGRPLLTIPVGATILQAALSGNDLVLLVPGELRVYNATTGALTHTWPLPAAQIGGPCRDPLCDPYPNTSDVDLSGAANDRAAYTLNGTAYLIRLSDGATAPAVDATQARLTQAGLFYAHQGAPQGPSRVSFIPDGQLPLRSTR